MQPWVLVTGGAGYIGSHTVIQLQQAGYQVVVLDNLSNANPEVFNRIARISGQRPCFVEGDICNQDQLEQLFERYTISAVIHFAGLKSVGESVRQPLRYYHNNMAGSLTLLQVMQAYGCQRLVFSSSATVYGDPQTVPVPESAPLSATNPYGQSKLMVELMLQDLARSDAGWSIALLRYFNPVGAHVSGLIGEDPQGIPNNLMPFVAQVAVGLHEYVRVFGDDYPTPDGTGVRDYIHVEDLAAGHLQALRQLQHQSGCQVYNLGTGRGYSVLEVIQAFAQASGRPIPYQIDARRPGDVASCYADPQHSRTQLGWQARYDLRRMVTDHWRWQSLNPAGYRPTP